MKTEISSLEDLTVCLRGERLSAKLTVLQEVYKHVEQAGKLGKKTNPALTDLLYERYEQTEGKEERAWCTCILLRIDDARKYAVAEKEFFTQQDNAILLLCAHTISSMPASRRAAMLSRLVMEADSATRQRLAANLLSDCMAVLEPDVALRVAILSDHDLPMEEVTPDTLDVWIRELTGSYRLNVRRILAGKSSASFIVLLENWKKLPSDLTAWVLTQAVKKQIHRTKDIVMEILETCGDVVLLGHALNVLKRLSATESDERTLEPLYLHKENSIRAAALEVGRTELPWDRWLNDGVSDDLRLAVLRRITQNQHKTSISVLDRLLQDKNWRIRARTTEALTALAPDSLDVLNAHLMGDHQEARISAAQALQRLGKETGTEAIV